MGLSSEFGELIDLWFPHDFDDPEGVRERAALWFGGDASFDATLEARFRELPDRATELHCKAVSFSVEQMLALVIALDQLPRNLYRNSLRAYQYDPIAVEIASRVVDDRLDEQIHPLHAMFLYMPLEHAEDRDCQARSVVGFRRLLERASVPLKAQFEQFLGYAERHKSVISRFGRYPHRNRVLNRTSTAAEIAYLESGGETFG